MREFIEYIVKNLVDNPKEIQITEEEIEGKTSYKLNVGNSDIGKVIGKKGRTAQAIRTLLYAIAAKNGKHILFEVSDNKKES